MNIEEREYSNIDIREPEIAKEDEIFSKQTLLHSPIFKEIIPNFRVAVNKEFRGLTSDSFNDELDQFLGPKEEDSQIDVFSDDEDLFNIGEIPNKTNKLDEDKEPLIFKNINVIVKLTSLLVNDVEFHLNAQVRSSCVLRGIRSQNEVDDSLLISLKSGFLLLLRMFYISVDGESTPNSDDQSHNFIFKPYIVQWWDTSSELSVPSLYSSGYCLRSNSSGLSAVSTSASSVFRIYNVQHTKYGVMLSKHYNVPIDGLILQSCFARPLGSHIIDHSILMTLVFTSFNRLEINLFEWSISEGVSQTLRKSILPLDNTFKIPIFVVPLNVHGGFLFVNQDELVLITIHDIISANYDFVFCPFTGAFPTNFYMPETNIMKENEADDEVILSTDNGVLYSVIISDDNSITIKPILRVTDSVSLFSLENESTGYRMIFGSHTGSNRELIIPEIYSTGYLNDLVQKQKLKYSHVSIVTDYKNWSPMLDVQLTDSFKPRSISNINCQEVWALSGSGKRTKLTQVRHGYTAIKISKTYEKLRKAEKIYSFQIEEHTYILCSLPFEAVLLEYQPEFVEKFAEIEDSVLVTDFKTVLLTTRVLNGTELIIQITENCILLSTLSDAILKYSFTDKKVIACHMLGDSLVLVIENIIEKSMYIEIFKIHDAIEKPMGIVVESNFMQSLALLKINYQISFLKLIDVSSTLYLLAGTFDGKLLVYKVLSRDLLEHFECDLAKDNPYLRNTFFNPVIANDLIQLKNKNMLFIATKEGYIIQFQYDNNFTLKLENYLRIGDTPTTFCDISNDANSFLICSRSLLKINTTKSCFPSRVYFEERFDRSITTMVQLPYNTKRDDNMFCFIREDGLTVASVNYSVKPNIMQVSVGESAKKFIYLQHISTFAILCESKDQTRRLKLIDRKLLRLVNHSEFNFKLKTESIFEVNEYPLCTCIWSIKRQNKISKKLLVGCSVNGIKGSFKVLDINKNISSDDELRVTELTSFDHRQPITNIQQISNIIVFSSGQSIYSTSYDLDEKRLKPIVNLMNLPSDVVSLSSQNLSTLLVTTKSDSIYCFELITEDVTGNITEMLKLVASDPSSKSLVNQVQLNKRIITGDKLHSSLLFMDQNNFSIQNQLTLKMSSISRVYPCDFNRYWSDSYNVQNISNSGILCVGVNGEIVLIRSLFRNSREFEYMEEKLSLMKVGKSLNAYVDSLDVPFIDKVNGKGLITPNKKYLDYKDNKNQSAFIDYDIEELSNVCWSEVYI